MTTNVHFDGDDRMFPVLAIVRRWNGWAVPRVTAEVREQLAAHLDSFGAEAAQEVRWLRPEPDGTIVVDLGLTLYTEEKE